MKTQLFNALTVVILFLMPNVNFGQAPDLGAASSFALFTSAGAINNNGSTEVTGDVGTYVGPINGLFPGAVNGQIYYEGNTYLIQVMTDVGLAYGYLFGLTPDAVIGVTLGGGQTLTPGVYSTGTGAEASLAGNLTLDGQDNPDALFIIQIDGAFETSTFSSVSLINSASLCNVYWQITGAFHLGDYSVFRGTIVSGGAIELLEGSSLLGRGLTRAGAIDLHNNSVINSCAPSSAVPISTWALVLGGALIAIGVFVRYRLIV